MNQTIEQKLVLRRSIQQNLEDALNQLVCIGDEVVKDRVLEMIQLNLQAIMKLQIILEENYAVGR